MSDKHEEQPEQQPEQTGQPSPETQAMLSEALGTLKASEAELAALMKLVSSTLATGQSGGILQISPGLARALTMMAFIAFYSGRFGVNDDDVSKYPSLEDIHPYIDGFGMVMEFKAHVAAMRGPEGLRDL